MKISPIGTLLLVCAIGFVQWPRGDRTFHYDDFHSIVHNPHIRTLESVPHFFSDPTQFSLDEKQAMYRPIVLTSYALNYGLDELNVRGYRLFNIVVHALNSVLVLYLVRTLYASSLIAWVSSLFFAFHPLSVETVHYVSSRSESLMSLGVLVSLFAYVRWSGNTSLRGFYLLSVAAFTFSLLSKSVGCVVLILMPLCDWLLNRPVLARVKAQVAHWILFGGYLLLSHQIVGKAIGSPVRPPDVQIWTQVKAFVYYVWLSLVPVRLNAEHQFFVSQSPLDIVVLLSGVCILSLLLVAVIRGGRRLAFGMGWWAISLLPASAVPLIVLVNEHRLYLALVGGGIVWGWVLHNAANCNARVALITLPVYTIIVVLLTVERVQVWRSEFSLWSDAAAKAPAMLKPHLRLGDARVARGEWRGAEEAYLHALGLRPDHPAARNNLGRLYIQQGRFAEAEDQFRQLLAVSPDVIQARLNLASVQLRTGRWQEAERVYEEALLRGHTLGEAQKKLGYISLQYRGDPQRAVEYYRQGLQIRPDGATWTALGAALRALGQHVEAERAYKAALLLDENSPDTWFNLANLYRDMQRLTKARDGYQRVVDSAVEPLASEALKELHLLIP